MQQRAPLEPLALMDKAPWNVIEAGGCRIACFENEEDAREALAIHSAAQQAFSASQQVPFEWAVIHGLLSGHWTRENAEWWAKDPDCPKVAKCVAAINKHLEIEPGTAFTLYLGLGESPAVTALRAILAEPYGCSFCDSGKLRDPEKGHETDCGYALAMKVLDEAAT